MWCEIVAQLFEDGVFRCVASSVLPNYSYFKEKADGKDSELRIFSTCFSRKSRFCTVSAM